MCSRGAGGDEGGDGLEVLFRVHADGGVTSLQDADRYAVLEETQLLEVLGALQGRGRERVEGVEDGAPVSVHAHVLPVNDLARPVAIEGNGQPGEVEGIAVDVGDHLVRRP